MRRIPSIAGLLMVSAAVPATAMDRYGNVTPGARTSVADPDERIDRMVAASTPTDRSHGKPSKSARNILRDDPFLRDAFAWLDNK